MSSSIVSIQNSLSAGELSPSLRGRTDTKKYGEGTSTCRNFFANYRGGVSSRAGLAYVGTCKQQYPTPPRDIPFQFSLNQGFALEFGHLYMRIKSDGAYVTEATVAVTSVSTSGLFTTGVVHGYSVGDWVYDLGNTGFTGLTWVIASVPTTNEFTVNDLFGNPITSATASTVGTVARIYTVISPYHAVDLPYLKYTQSADVMTLTCVNTATNTEYPPYSLVRSGNTSWTFTAETFASSTTAPTGLSAVAQSGDTVTTWYSYVVTAVDNVTGEESVASLPVNIQNVDISTVLGSNSLSWAEVSGASSYKVYASVPSFTTNVPVSSLYGYIGTALGPAFTDTNITPDFTKVPPQHSDPFARGIISQVNITAGGNGHYSQQTVGYSVSSATGSGFSGTPVISNGKVAGFVIYNPGINYQAADTITFSDSGGGLATGAATFTSNPADTNSMNLGGIFIHFAIAPAPAPNAGGQFIYSEIENTVALTVQTLANNLNASNILSLAVASYTASGNVLTITYKTPGTIGNVYPMSTVSAPVTFSGTTLAGGGTVGSGATGTLSVGAESGTYPSVAAYFQQRRVYASSLNNPDTYWMTQPGLFSNMDSSIPVTDGDSITGTPWAQQVNGIQFLVPMPGGLVVLTGKGAWQLNGGSSAAITPSNQNAVPQAYNGCNNFVNPLTINYDILYIQSKGSIARDLAYNFFTNIYTGTDLTILSNHLFTDFQITQWCWCEEPNKLVWALRNDGTLLCLTYLKEQDVYSWTRHDTNGLFVSVCSITEPPVDALYVITQRFVQGAWRYYSERMDNRTWNNVEDSFCVDSGLSYPMKFPEELLNIGGTFGSNIQISCTLDALQNVPVGAVIRAGGGVMTVTQQLTVSSAIVDITIPVTDTVSNDPTNRVVPQQPGTWSWSVPTTTVSGLNHINGLQVSILADGSVVPNQTVVNNSIILPVAASQIVVGLPYTCQVQTMPIDVPSKGTVQNKRKTINAVGVRVEATRGITVGADQPDASSQQNYVPLPWTNMNEIKERTPSDFPGNSIPLYTGDYYKTVMSGWDVEGQIAIQQAYPLPANILALISYWTVGDDG